VTALDRLFTECQRLWPLFAINAPQYTTRDCAIRGVQLPKGTQVGGTGRGR
jgi:cytochrome P450